MASWAMTVASFWQPFFSYLDVQEAAEREEKARHELLLKGISLGVVLVVWIFLRWLATRKVTPSREARAFYATAGTVVILIVLGGGAYAIYLWKWGGGVPTQLLAGLVALMGLFDYFTVMEKRAGQGFRDAAEVRETDPRAPVLYLRGFEQEDQPASTQRKLFGAFDATGLEGAVLPAFEKIGPVIGLRNIAKDRIPTPYAVESVAGDAWKEVVSARIREAACIVIILSDTSGLRWELAAAVRANAITKSVWILPPGPREQHAMQITALAEEMRFRPRLEADLLAVAKELDHESESSLALVFDADGRPSRIGDFAGFGYSRMVEKVLERFATTDERST